MTAKSLKILAIDDNPDNLTALKAVVNERLPTAKVFTVSNGRKGLDLAFAYDPDVILLDIVMPEMDGFEVCRRLKDDQFLHAIPVVFLTALRTDRESRIRALEIGAESFLSKPFDEVEIIAQIRAMAKIKAANRRTQIEKDHLEALVKERTMELQKSHAQLLHSEKLSAVGSFSASIAHEFGNPLQGVMVVLNGLSQYATLEEEQQKLVSLALQECRRMKDLIAGLRDFHRPTSGKLEPVDLHAVFDALLLIIKKELLTRRISVVKKYADNFPTVIGVADQLKQVLINLLNNASYACESGGTITLATATAEDGVVVHIKDTGTGISQKESEPDLRAVLHDQARDERHRLRTVGKLRHHQNSWRSYRGEERSWQGLGLFDLSASYPNKRGHLFAILMGGCTTGQTTIGQVLPGTFFYHAISILQPAAGPGSARNLPV